MKNINKRLRLLFIVCFVFLTACNSANNEENTSSEEDTTIDQNSNEEVTEDESDIEDSRDSTVDSEAADANEDENVNAEADNAEDNKIKLTFNNEEVIVNMDDNPTSNDFLALLPLTLTFEEGT